MTNGQFLSIFVGCCLGSVALMAQPQSYPQKPIRVIVPVAAGGTTDLTARLVGQKMAERLGQAVIVENRPGGNETIGTEVVAKSAPDGYTVLLAAPASIVILPHLQKLPYTAERDLAPVSLAAITPLILVVHPSVAAATVKDLIALAKARPGQLSYASAGSGGVQHLAAELLKSTAKIDIVHIPYKGAGPVMQDLVGGQVQIFFAGMPPAMPHVRSGKLRALAVTTTTRSSAAPDVVTMEEAGVPRFDISNWFAYFVPAGTPGDVIGRLNGEIVRALKQQDVREKLAAAGADALGSSPEELASFMRAEGAKFAELIKVSGARLD
ncbi:MAG: Bug family tripartite tricarboxylate transporter substrate binding protein [Burkholderiales bacterium]